MNPIVKIATALRFVANHPVNQGRRFRAVMEYGFIQMAARIVPGDVCVEFPNHTRLLIPPRMKGAAHYIAPRLCEFEEMAFVMHFLRAGDLFVDVGANIGAFTIMAAGVGGARVMAFEASPDTYAMLSRNVWINDLRDRIHPIHAAAGRTTGTTRFSAGLGTENCVRTGEMDGIGVSVPMTTLDQELAGTAPDLLKVDVEGYETEVFAGGITILRDPKLKAILVERNNLGARYGFDEGPLHREIQQCGFKGCNYDPFSRRVFEIEEGTRENIIYVRDLEAANARLKSAPAFTLGNLSF